MLKVYCSEEFRNEREYIFRVIFEEFLGQDFEFVFEKRKDILILSGLDDNKSLSCADLFFNMEENKWLTPKTLPLRPLDQWAVSDKEISGALVEPVLPVIYGVRMENNDFLSITEAREIKLGIDIFGSAFFMLSRYEEIVGEETDLIGRFSANLSLAKKENFLHRPIINEYVEILWICLKKLWPVLKRKERHFEMVPTHDVDMPFELTLGSPARLLGRLAGDLVVRRDFRKFIRSIKKGYLVKTGAYWRDDYYTFENIMDISEKNGVISRFYFMAGQSNSKYENKYYLDNKNIHSLMNKISDRGHILGMHPSFETFRDGVLLKTEFDRLKKVCSEIGIRQIDFGARQHYLRWKCPDTWRIYEDCGIIYDTTLTYADYMGYRCGVCYEYPVYDSKERKGLKLKEKPLMFMDASIFEEQYMGLSLIDAGVEMMKLKAITKKYNGSYVFLWHNNRLISEESRDIFDNVLKT